jgi:hypothetical protein
VQRGAARAIGGYAARHGGSLGWRQAAGTPAVLVAVGLVVLLQLGFTYAPPLQAMFGTAALTAGELALCVGAGVALFVMMEAEKWLVRRLSRR